MSCVPYRYRAQRWQSITKDPILPGKWIFRVCQIVLKMDFPPNYGRILGGFELEIGRRSVLLTPGPGNGRERRLAVHDTARGRVPIPDSRLPPAAGGIPVPPPQGPAAAKCIPVPARQTVPSRGQLPYRYGGGFGIGTAGMSLCGISAGSPTVSGPISERSPNDLTHPTAEACSRQSSCLHDFPSP